MLPALPAGARLPRTPCHSRGVHLPPPPRRAPPRPAQAVSSGLGQQRAVFEGLGGKLAALGAKFPVVNTLMNAIRRRKNRDNLVLAAVVAGCTLFILLYWWRK